MTTKYKMQCPSAENDHGDEGDTLVLLRKGLTGAEGDTLVLLRTSEIDYGTPDPGKHSNISDILHNPLL